METKYNRSENSTPRAIAAPGVRLERWGWYSVALNVLLAAFHGLIANASGSLAVAAELIHNVVDLLMAVAVLIGLRLATRKSEAFPYGLYKVENLTASGLAVMIFVSAYEIVREALLAPSAPIRAQPWMLGLLLITTAIPLFFSHFEMRSAREANSPALLADAREYRIHVFTTGLAFVALFSQWLRFPVDRIAALLIVVVVVKTGWDVLRDAMRVLLDASLDAETLQHIRQVIDAVPAVSELRWVTGRNAGRFRFVEAGVTLRVAQLGKAEEVLGRIEAAVRAAVPHVERVLLHVESPAVTHLCYAVPLADRLGAVSVHFGESPYFALVTIRRADGGVEEQRIISNPHRTEEKAKGIRVAEWLVSLKIDVVLLQEDVRGKGPEYVLRDAGVIMRLTDKPTLDEALSSLPP
ncbi:MAG: cation diffusion facilitator family transporter [Proteobacteria bacterium]|nr:cation diffusion facilitator family transporter [Pseudomonadota bacterium]MBU4295184.1 cation diffusion facilitator family transporter [Pseudomonadota bacterium]MCG2749034.1 cation diffusion facilitator family transporter [Desulfobulbaceae bacterium]